MNLRNRLDVTQWSRTGRRRTLTGAAWIVLTIFALPALGEVQLNEIMADPAQDWDGDAVYNFRDDEWVEIINQGSTTVSVDGYRLASADTTWRFEFSGTLVPGEVRVVYGSQSYAWEQATGNPQYGLRLGNTGGSLSLWRLDTGDTTLVDSYTYADHEAEDDRSTGRFPDGSSTWWLFDGMNPYSGETPPFGTGCNPSPGDPAACPTSIETRTWGAMKGRYLR